MIRVSVVSGMDSKHHVCMAMAGDRGDGVP